MSVQSIVKTCGWWTLEEAAAEAGVSRRLVRDWARDHRRAFRCRRTPHGTLLRGRCVHSADFLRWLESGTDQAVK